MDGWMGWMSGCLDVWMSAFSQLHCDIYHDRETRKRRRVCSDDHDFIIRITMIMMRRRRRRSHACRIFLWND